MAHQLEIRDGRASFFSVKETAWHKLGTVLPEAPSFDEAIRLIRADYRVEKVPHYLRHAILNADGSETGDFDFTRSELSCATVRTDTGAELGRVTPDYEPVQNLDAFGALRPLLDAGIARLETGGVLRHGATAWLALQFDLERFGPVVREVFAGEVVPFGVARADHSGKGSNYIATTPVRIVCANTLAAAEGNMQAIRIPHVGDAVEKTIDAAREVFGGLVERCERIALGYRALKAHHLSREQFAELILDPIAADPRTRPDFNPEAKLAEVVVRRIDAKRAELLRCWMQGKGHSGDGSAWEAYNGLVETLDHTETFPTRKGGAWKVATLMDGRLARYKGDAFDRLLRHAAKEGDTIARAHAGEALRALNARGGTLALSA